ncbi:DUF3592 domain-containing protein [Streptomyces huiliensis]|uniref:DUF3592 domain-containing protein n=1 Tax=Streptomyces huiliensis TaxID=2876027 RepID=UPI001CC1C0B7|nr:DUF3592 domain-containing protein [Streptomyces huiliensis]MBZ4320614.1 hypothetical protein [Streptomyces huiliensis]
MAAATWMVVQIVRMNSVARKGVPVEAVCDHNKWNEGMVSSVCTFTAPDGAVVHVQTPYFKEPVLDPGQVVTARFDADDPENAVIPEYVEGDHHLIWVAVAAFASIGAALFIRDLM